MIQYPNCEKPWPFNSLDINPRAQVLVLAPHPDDFDAIGVTMKRLHDQGNRIFVAVISSGHSGVEDRFCSPPNPREKTRVREAEQRASCQFFNLPPSHLTFLRLDEDEASHPLDTPTNVDTVRAHFRHIDPDLVFLPHGNDTNVTHQLTYAFFRRLAPETTRPLTAFLIRDPKTIEMQTDVVAWFGEDEANWKGQLLRYHRSQHERNLNTRQHGFDERILQVNRQIAASAPVDAMYAEAFELEHWHPS